MDFVQFSILILAFIGLFTWNRHMDAKLEVYRELTTAFHEAIRQDMKDFHTKLAVQDMEFKMRLSAIEERRLSKNNTT